MPSKKSRYRYSYDTQPPAQPAALQEEYTDHTLYSYYKDENLPSFLDWRWKWQDAALSCKAREKTSPCWLALRLAVRL